MAEKKDLETDYEFEVRCTRNGKLVSMESFVIPPRNFVGTASEIVSECGNLIKRKILNKNGIPDSRLYAKSEVLAARNKELEGTSIYKLRKDCLVCNPLHSKLGVIPKGTSAHLYNGYYEFIVPDTMLSLSISQAEIEKFPEWFSKSPKIKGAENG